MKLVEQRYAPGGSSAELSRSRSFLGVVPGVVGIVLTDADVDVDVDVDFFLSLEHHFQSGCALKCASFTCNVRACQSGVRAMWVSVKLATASRLSKSHLLQRQATFLCYTPHSYSHRHPQTHTHTHTHTHTT